MTIKQQEHFLRTLIEMSARLHGCEVEKLTFAPIDNAEKCRNGGEGSVSQTSQRTGSESA